MDYEKILTLLEVVQMAAGHPQLKAIGDSAMADLVKIATPPKAEAPAPVREVPRQMGVRPASEFRRDV